MEVYLDVIWALNFLFDSLLLYLTALFLKRDIRIWRIFTGGLVGSVLILLMITPFQTISGHPFTKLLFSVVMVIIAFGYKRFRYFVSGLMTFYLATFLIGGTLIGTHYFIQFDLQLSAAVLLANVKGFGDPISWLFVVIGFPLAWHFSRRKVEGFEISKIRYDSFIPISIVLAGKTYNFKGLIDSGNQLYDPISRTPVMVVSIGKRKDEFPDPIVTIAENGEEIMMGNDDIPGEWKDRMRIIPYKVVGQEHQLIVALKPEQIYFEKDEQWMVVEKGLVSFTLQQLSADDDFECIVHPKMVTSTVVATEWMDKKYA